jgi:hypothetical protein
MWRIRFREELFVQTGRFRPKNRVFSTGAENGQGNAALHLNWSARAVHATTAFAKN